MNGQKLNSRTDALDGRRILIVEDEYHLADEIARALREHGAKIRGPVGTLAAARNATGPAGELDAVVLDLRLAADRTTEIADCLEAQGVPFVFTTGYDSSVLPARHRHAAHLEKPCDLNRLVRVLADFFD